jgi:hypothetical protein
MSDTYCAHAIIGVRIPRIQIMLRELEKRNMIEQVGCERKSCVALSTRKFCPDCGRESVVKIHKLDEDTDTYIAFEWFGHKFNEHGFSWVTANDVYGSKEDIEVYVGVMCSSDSTGDHNPAPGFIDQCKLSTMNVDDLKTRLANTLGDMLGDLWEFKEENFGLWAVVA